MLDIEKTIREYLPTVCHMSLATSRGDRPWICEVHYVFDDDLNLYFFSKAQRRHSLEIADNPNISGNIVKQHEVGEKVRGVYFEGKAGLVIDISEDNVGFILYDKKFAVGKEILDESKEENGHKLYKITVSKFYLFDSVDSSPSQKYELEWKTYGEN